MSMWWASVVNAIVGARLANPAICWSFGEMVLKPDVFIIVPSGSSVYRCLSFLRGVPRVGSPASSVLLRHSDSPSHIPRHFASFVRRYLAQTSRPGYGGASQVPGGPLCTCPALRPRRDHRAGPVRQSALQHERCCLPLMQRRRLPHLNDFGALSHALHTRCLRFAVTVTRCFFYHHPRLASGWRPTLAGRRR